MREEESLPQTFLPFLIETCEKDAEDAVLYL